MIDPGGLRHECALSPKKAFKARMRLAGTAYVFSTLAMAATRADALVAFPSKPERNFKSWQRWVLRVVCGPEAVAVTTE